MRSCPINIRHALIYNSRELISAGEERGISMRTEKKGEGENKKGKGKGMEREHVKQKKDDLGPRLGNLLETIAFVGMQDCYHR